MQCDAMHQSCRLSRRWQDCLVALNKAAELRRETAPKSSNLAETIMSIAGVYDRHNRFVHATPCPSRPPHLPLCVGALLVVVFLSSLSHPPCAFSCSVRRPDRVLLVPPPRPTPPPLGLVSLRVSDALPLYVQACNILIENGEGESESALPRVHCVVLPHCCAVRFAGNPPGLTDERSCAASVWIRSQTPLRTLVARLDIIGRRTQEADPDEQGSI